MSNRYKPSFAQYLAIIFLLLSILAVGFWYLGLRKEYQRGTGIRLSFEYPSDWSVYNSLNVENQDDIRLDPNPIIIFPEYNSAIEGLSSPMKEGEEFQAKVNELLEGYSVTQLNWKMPVEDGKCYEVGFDSDTYGKVEGEVRCYLLFGESIYQFTASNINGYLDEVDGDRKIVRRFIESLSLITE